MRIHITVGDLTVKVTDCEYTKREVKELLKTMSSIYLAIVESSTPLGAVSFTVRANDPRLVSARSHLANTARTFGSAFHCHCFSHHRGTSPCP